MSLTALIKGTNSIVEASEVIAQPKGRHYICRYCRSEVRLRRPHIRSQTVQVAAHFFHLAQECQSNFEGHPESSDHRLLKMLLKIELLKRGWLNIRFEEPIAMPWRPKGRIADVVSFERNSDTPHVWEIQLAAITPDELRERTEDYVKAGYEPHWLLGKAGNTPANQQVVWDLLAECFVVHLNPLETTNLGQLGQADDIHQGDKSRSSGPSVVVPL